jgi:signal transduction histidine kinase
MSKKRAGSEGPDEGLINYLEARLETIFVNWRIQCEADPEMNSKSSFSREEFNDQVPVMMKILFLRLRKEKVELDPVVVASEHGLHRWQSGYSLPELLRELEHLFSIILDEVNVFFDKNPERIESGNVLFVHQQIFKIYAEANRGSMFYYHQLTQNDAAERAHSLEFALDQLQQLGQQRGEHLRQSSHDLRSTFSILMVASQMLEMPTTEKERDNLMQMLNRNLTSIREMLMQLTDYARIEAGQDTLEIKKFDVAALVRETLKSAEPLAKQHGIDLQGAGPETLNVESDRVKVQRILLNLLYNALKYTRVGGIYVTWAQETPSRWTLSIQDTGPGFTPNSPAALLAEQLKPSLLTTASHQEPELLKDLPAPKKDDYRHVKESEGLGLFIVKKLCELMNAAMDIESIPNKGTLIRIRFAVKQEPSKAL